MALVWRARIGGNTESGSLIPGVNYFPVRRTEALDIWASYGEPTPEAWSTTCYWVAGLFDTPWQYPSVPVPALSSQPNYEVREANLDCGVWVVYQHSYIEYWTDLLVVF